MIIINIAQEYTKTPGGRFIKEGPFSGEDFRKKLLKPKFEDACKTGQQLRVVLDGGYGYATSFLEEAFGGLARELQDRAILSIEIVSDEEPVLIEKIKTYIESALQVKR